MTVKDLLATIDKVNYRLFQLVALAYVFTRMFLSIFS